MRWILPPMFAAALGSVAPGVRWCPLDWDQIAEACMLRCSIAPTRPAPICPLASAAEQPSAPAPPACSVSPMSCGSGACPMASETCDRSTQAPTPVAPERPHHRAYLLESPYFAEAPHGVRIALPSPQAVGLPGETLALLAPANDPEPRPHALSEARPPTRDASAPPPVRGPPVQS